MKDMIRTDIIRLGMIKNYSKNADSTSYIYPVNSVYLTMAILHTVPLLPSFVAVATI